MASVAGKVSSAALRIVLAGLLFYQFTVFTKLYLTQRPNTDITHKRLNKTQFDTLIVCCPTRLCVFGGQNLKKVPNLMHAQGLWMHRFTPRRSLEAKSFQLDDSNDSSVLNFSEQDLEALLQDKYSILQFTEFNLLNGKRKTRRIGNVKGSLAMPGRYTLPTGCFKLPVLEQVALGQGYTSGRYSTRGIGNNTALSPDSAASFGIRFDIEQEKQRPFSVQISFYNGPHWPALVPSRHFSAKEFEFQGALRETWEMAATKYHYLKGSGCIDAPQGARYPIGFARDICETECDETASREMYNCSWFTVLGLQTADKAGNLMLFHNSGNYTNCNYWNIKQKFGEVFGGEYNKLWKACERRNGCSGKMFCDEWSITLSETESRKIGNRSHSVQWNVQIPDIVTNVDQVRALSFEQWVGNVGGLFGMYLGLSAADIIEKFVSMIKCRKKNEGSYEQEKEPNTAENE